MFKQAVYAGRNHTLSLAVALTLLASAPAQAADVAHVSLGSTITTLVASPDGGAWVRIARGIDSVSVGRAFPDGRFATTSVSPLVLRPGALGPDGQAWFSAGIRTLDRVDTQGRESPVPSSLTQDDPVLDQALATGPDGTMWVTTSDEKAIAHVSADGKAAFSPTQFPACKADADPVAMTQATDGTMWLADPICDRLVRISRAGAWSAVALRDAATDALAPDASGGVWFAGHNAVGHVDAAGQVRKFSLGRRQALGVAVTPDGNAW